MTVGAAQPAPRVVVSEEKPLRQNDPPART
jgi:hypothetical protein